MSPTACAMILTETTVLFAQEGANCQIDGFMRLLLQTTFRDIAALASLNMLNHHLLILKRESGKFISYCPNVFAVFQATPKLYFCATNQNCNVCALRLPIIGS